MALDELHARRLATVVNVLEAALDRVEVVLRSFEPGDEAHPGASPLTPEEIRQVRAKMKGVRERLGQALERFAIRRRKPHPRQVLAAELSTLWVVLENAMPRRLKGYGREFHPKDRADWEKLMQALLDDVEDIRRVAITQGSQGA